MKTKTNLSRRDFLRMSATAMAAVGATTYGNRVASAFSGVFDHTDRARFQGKMITIAGPDGFLGDGIDALLPSIQDATGATITFSRLPDVPTKVTADLSTGTGIYDIIVEPFTFLHANQASGFLVALDDYIAKDPGLDVADFIPVLLETYGRHDGKLWALPYHADGYLFYYRKDLFEDPKIQAAFKAKTGKDLKVPDTTDELLETAKFFAKKLNPDSPTQYGWAHMADKGSDSIWCWCSRLEVFGGSYLDKNFHPNFNNDAGLKAADIVLKLSDAGPDDMGEIGFNKLVTEFLGGDVAMCELWNPMANFAQQPDGFWGKTVVQGKVGFAVPPGAIIDGKLKKTAVLGGWAAAISKFSKEPDLSYKIISMLNSKQGEIVKVGVAGVDATRVSTYKNPIILAKKPHYPALEESYSNGRITADVDAPPVGSELQDILQTNLHRIWIKEIDAKTALADTESKWIDILKKGGLYK